MTKIKIEISLFKIWQIVNFFKNLIELLKFQRWKYTFKSRNNIELWVFSLIKVLIRK